MNKAKDVNDVVRGGGTFSGRGEPITRDAARERRKVAVAELVLEARCQTRAKADNEVIAEYAELYRDQAAKMRVSPQHAASMLPPIDVFDVKGKHVVVDGFHRVAAAVKAPIAFVEVIVVGRGTLDDAVLRALGANRAHGLRRSNADKRRAVMLAIEHPALKGKSDRAIAETCGVSYALVADVRTELESGWKLDPPLPAGKPAKSLGADRDSAGLGRSLPDSGSGGGKATGSHDPDPPRRQAKDGRWMPPTQPSTSNGSSKQEPLRVPQRELGKEPDTSLWDAGLEEVRKARLELQRLERENEFILGQAFRTAIEQLAAIESGIDRDRPALCPRCRGLDGNGAAACGDCRGKRTVTRARAEQIRGAMERAS